MLFLFLIFHGRLFRRSSLWRLVQALSGSLQMCRLPVEFSDLRKVKLGTKKKKKGNLREKISYNWDIRIGQNLGYFLFPFLVVPQSRIMCYCIWSLLKFSAGALPRSVILKQQIYNKNFKIIFKNLAWAVFIT